VGAWVTGGDGTGAWRMMWRDHQKTLSPNAGWTMAAMAGALGVELEKPGVYRLGNGELPTAEAIDRAIRVLLGASGLAVVASLAITVLKR